jgi:hypothetical protein
MAWCKPCYVHNCCLGDMSIEPSQGVVILSVTPASQLCCAFTAMGSSLGLARTFYSRVPVASVDDVYHLVNIDGSNVVDNKLLHPQMPVQSSYSSHWQ